MTPADASRAINARWISMWPTLSAALVPSTGVPYSFDNMIVPEGVPYFVTAEIDDVDCIQYTYGAPGNRKFRNSCILDAKVYIPPGQGRKNADVMRGWIADMFNAVRFGASGTELGITTFATRARKPRFDADSWILAVATPFEYYELR